MTKRVCVEAGCPTLVTEGRCTKHRRVKDKARGTRQQRGYDAVHDRLRAAYKLEMDQGRVFDCWRCGKPVGDDWQLGHDDHDRSKYRGPECLKCNLATAGRRRSRLAAGGGV